MNTSVAVELSFPPISWLKAKMALNMPLMSVTLDVSLSPPCWLNAEFVLNMRLVFVTLDVSLPPICWLKAEFVLNMWLPFVTLDVSLLPTGWLKGACRALRAAREKHDVVRGKRKHLIKPIRRRLRVAQHLVRI